MVSNLLIELSNYYCKYRGVCIRILIHLQRENLLYCGEKRKSPGLTKGRA